VKTRKIVFSSGVKTRKKVVFSVWRENPKTIRCVGVGLSIPIANTGIFFHLGRIIFCQKSFPLRPNPTKGLPTMDFTRFFRK
jgi:hypothetical protein